jgi:hypothetical protein
MKLRDLFFMVILCFTFYMLWGPVGVLDVYELLFW